MTKAWCTANAALDYNAAVKALVTDPKGNWDGWRKARSTDGEVGAFLVDESVLLTPGKQPTIPFTWLNIDRFGIAADQSSLRARLARAVAIGTVVRDISYIR